MYKRHRANHLDTHVSIQVVSAMSFIHQKTVFPGFYGVAPLSPLTVPRSYELLSHNRGGQSIPNSQAFNLLGVRMVSSMERRGESNPGPTVLMYKRHRANHLDTHVSSQVVSAMSFIHQNCRHQPTVLWLLSQCTMECGFSVHQ